MFAEGTGGGMGGGAAADDSVEGPPAPAPTAASGPTSVPLSASGTGSPAAVVPVVVELFFQVYPGKSTASGTAIGIPNAGYTISTGSGTPVSGTTDAAGRVQVSLAPGGSATLRIFDTDFTISARNTIEAVSTLAGQQRRLAMLGYDLGPGGVDGLRGSGTEKALVDFQVDAGLSIDAIAGSGTRTKLTHADWVGE